MALTEKRKIAVSKLKKPTSLEEVRSFLESINYFRKFISKLAERAASLHNLLRKKNPWRWEEAENEAYNDLITALITELVMLYVPDPRKTFVIDTDASTEAVAGILQQTDNRGNLRVVSYASRKLHGAEINRHIRELEAFAIV